MLVVDESKEIFNDKRLLTEKIPYSRVFFRLVHFALNSEMRNSQNH